MNPTNNISKAKPGQAREIAIIVSESNKDVAEKFNIAIQNNPKHPSFYNESWVLSDFQRGEEYFIYIHKGVEIACVAFEHPRPDTAYLNRLSVLPDYRDLGVGTVLVKHIFNYSRLKNVKRVSIGIIAQHERLKSWYEKLGFVEVEKRKFEHLPFDLTYMCYTLY